MEYVAGELERNGLPALAEKVLADKIESALGFGTLNENHGGAETTVLTAPPEEDEGEEFTPE